MKIVMITGSIPPDACGVGDYTVTLMNELRKQSKNVELVKLNFIQLLKLLMPIKDRVIHVQYPTQGYGYSLLPLLLVLIKNPVITLHEYSQVHPLRKLIEAFMMLFSTKVIVTTEHEKSVVSKIFFNIKRKTEVVPVFSAFPPIQNDISFNKRNGVIFFGLMRPNKGVEEFIELAKLLAENDNNLPIHVYSAIPRGGIDYFDKMKKLSANLDINWCMNKDLDEVSKGMSAAKYAYLDFPDGVSARRSSFMAAISHGLLVFSKKGLMTPINLNKSFINVQTPNQVKDKINYFENNLEEAKKVSEYAEMMSKDYSVANIAKLHSEIYCRLGARG